MRPIRIRGVVGAAPLPDPPVDYSGTMKLSKGVRYALRMMVAIAKASDGTSRVSLSRVAQTTMMPRRYLEQLAIPLRKAGLLRGTTGRGGGYVLARPPDEIRVRQIIESIVGPVGITSCALDPGVCVQADGCECRLLYTLVNDKIAEVVEGLSLADLIQGSWTESARLHPPDQVEAGTPTEP